MRGFMFLPPSAQKTLAGSIKGAEEQPYNSSLLHRSNNNPMKISKNATLPRWQDILNDQMRLNESTVKPILDTARLGLAEECKKESTPRNAP